jgi:hypothetical protein
LAIDQCVSYCANILKIKGLMTASWYRLNFAIAAVDAFQIDKHTQPGAAGLAAAKSG